MAKAASTSVLRAGQPAQLALNIATCSAATCNNLTVAERRVFCEIVRGEGPEEIVGSDQNSTVADFAARDQRPTNLGHMLVVTCEHYRNLYDLPPSLYEEVMTCLRRTAEAVQLAFAATGSTIRQNNEPPGQDVFHLHFHVMPRHPSDNKLDARYEVVDLASRIAQAQAVRGLLSAPYSQGGGMFP